MIASDARFATVRWIRRFVAVVMSVSFVTLGLVLSAPTAGATPNLVADYQFQTTHSSGVGTAPDLVDIGSGTNTFATDTVDGNPTTVLTFPADNGLSLSPTTGLITDNSYSVVVLFKFATVTGFRRILDFKDGTSDDGLYQSAGNLDFFPSASAADGAITAGSYVQVVLTDDSGTVTGYVNGNQEFQFTDSTDLATIDSNNVLRFFQDNTSGGVTTEDSAGAVARIRLYDGALSTTDVAALDREADTSPHCTMGAGLPRKPPKPNMNTGLVKFSPSIKPAPAAKGVNKVTISGSLENCVNFDGIPEKVGTITNGSVKLSFPDPGASTCDDVVDQVPPPKGMIAITWKAPNPNPKKPGTFVKAETDKANIVSFKQSSVDPRVFTVVSDVFAKSKTTQLQTLHATVVVRVDEDESTITTLCHTPKKGLGKLHFTGAAGVSTIELQ